MQVTAINANDGGASATSASAQDTATSAFGLSFDSLLQIVLTQLTYQDPLKPMDNFEFVSQLAQFSQIQLGETTNDNLKSLVSAQANLQATGLLGRQVDVSSSDNSGAVVTGKVTAIAFDSGTPVATIETSGGSTISGISLSSISQIREDN